MVILLLLLGTICLIDRTVAIKPPGYVEKPKPYDPNPPKYRYGYSIGTDDKGGGPQENILHSNGQQGHKEQRDGDNTKGNYYVNLPEGQSHANVQYVADDWGYHPVVRYDTHGDHSHSSAHFALGHSAVQALHGRDPGNMGNREQADPINLKLPNPGNNDKDPNQQQQTHPQQSQSGNLQIVGIIPQRYPTYLHRPLHTTLLFPILDPQHQQIYQQQNEQDHRNQLTHIDPISRPDQSIAKLVETTQNLVSNEDVLNINDAAENSQEIKSKSDQLFVPATVDDKIYHAASAAQIDAIQNDSFDQRFNQPIIVEEEEEPKQIDIGEPSRAYLPTLPDVPSKPQINVQILDDSHNRGQYLKETTFLQPPHAEKLQSVGTDDKELESRKFLRRFKIKGNQEPVQSTDSAVYSTTSSTVETTTTKNLNHEIFVTPSIRPVSNTFLAPIQAALRLSSGHGESINGDGSKEKPLTSEKTVVEVQKSVNLKNILINEEFITPVPRKSVFGARNKPKNSKILKESFTIEKSLQPIQIDHLISYPVQETTEVVKQIPIPVYRDRLIEKPIPYPVEVEKIVEKKVEVPIEIHKSIPVPYPVEKVIEKPVHITKYIDRPYPVEKIVKQNVHIPYPVEKIVEKFIDRPYPVDRKIPIPYPVEKIIEKPVTVEKIVEKLVDRPVPYPVEKIINRPYPVEKVIEKYIDRPYEVERIVEKHVKVPYPVQQIVEKIVDRPVEVEKIVEKPVPYPVNKYIDRPYPVEKIVEKQIPYPVEKLVEKIVDRPVEVEKIVEKYVNVPVPYDRIVEKYIDRPIHVPYSVPVPVHVPYPVEKRIPYPVAYPVHQISQLSLVKYPKSEKSINKHIFLDGHNLVYPSKGYHYYPSTIKHVQLPNSLSSGDGYNVNSGTTTVLQPVYNKHLYLSTPTNLKPVYGVPYFIKTRQPTKTTHLYGKYHPHSHITPKLRTSTHYSHKPSTYPNYIHPFNPQYAQNYGYQIDTIAEATKIYKDDYSGPPPPNKNSDRARSIDYWLIGSNGSKYRRDINFGKNLRMEYGFKPPMRPSIEIDEQGNPINQEGEDSKSGRRR